MMAYLKLDHFALLINGDAQQDGCPKQFFKTLCLYMAEIKYCLKVQWKAIPLMQNYYYQNQ